jgi:dCMP deaminase
MAYLSEWDLRFLRLAKEISTWSKDPSTQVGAVLVDNRKRIVSTGYNGLPQGVEDDAKRYLDKDVKLRSVLHAEENAVLFAGGLTQNCTISVYPFQPCAHCASMLIQAGVSRVVSVAKRTNTWSESFSLARELFGEAKVPCDIYLGVRV